MTDEVIEKAADILSSSEYEGFSEKPYKGDDDVWTIGYGTTKGVTANTSPIDKVIARKWLIRDITEVNNFINSAVEPLINKNQKLALILFVYNIGVGNFKESTMLRRLNAKDFLGASEQFKRWVFIKGTKSNGLIKRRNREAGIFLQPAQLTKEVA
jgi:lysozyme